MAQTLGDIGADGKAQTRLIPGLQGRKDQAVVGRRLIPAQTAIERPHGRAKLQPDCFGQGQHGRGLGPQIKRAVKFEIGADIGHGVLMLHGLRIGGVDCGQTVDQRKMGAGQRTGGKLRLQQRADRGKLFQAFG